MQGSKSGGFFYSIYTIEVTDLPSVMKNQARFLEFTWKSLCCREETQHDITQYVDDSSNVIGAASKKALTGYAEEYLVLLAAYYRANKLQLNAEKTTFMMVGAKYTNRRRNKVIIHAANSQIEDDYAIKILGWWISPDGKVNYHLNKI